MRSICYAFLYNKAIGNMYFILKMASPIGGANKHNILGHFQKWLTSKVK